VISKDGGEHEQMSGAGSDIAFYSRSTSPGIGMTADAVRNAIRPIVVRWKNIGTIKVIDTQTDLPAHLIETISRSEGKGKVEGIFDPETKGIFLVASNISSKQRAQEVILHEAIGHYGVEGLLGKDIKPILSQVYIKRMAEAKEIAAQYNFDLKTMDGKHKAAREILARMAEREESNSLLQKVYAAIRNWLRKMGFTVKLSDVDMRDLIARAGKFVERGEDKGLSGSVVMSTKEIKPFYSQLQKVISDQMPNQVTPTLFNKIIGQNREGIRGIKPEEIADAKATVAAIFGDKKIMSKQEILDYLRAVDRTNVQDVVLGKDLNDETRITIRPNGDMYADGIGKVGSGEDLKNYIDEDHKIEEDGSVIWRNGDLDEPLGVFDEHNIAGQTHFSQYTVPGMIEGSYREQFVTANESDLLLLSPKESELRDLNKLSYRRSLTDEELKRGAELQKELGPNALHKIIDKTWQDGHSEYADIRNPIVRIRFNDRIDLENPEYKAYRKEMQDKYGNDENILNKAADGEIAKLDELGRNKVVRFIEELQGPSKENEAKMPEIYRKYRYQIGLKRILQGIAEENGQRAKEGKPLITRLAWTTGEMQAVRYDLSKHIDELLYMKHADGSFTLEASKEGTMIDLGNKADNLEESELESVVGKELAKKIINGEGKTYDKTDTTIAKSLSGLDLKVGGEGLKRLYDVTIPKFLEKYTGQTTEPLALEAHMQIGSTTLKLSKQAKGTPVPAIPITPALQASILHEGQPMFSKGKGDIMKSVDNTKGKAEEPTAENPKAEGGILKIILHNGNGHGDGGAVEGYLDIKGRVFVDGHWYKPGDIAYFGRPDYPNKTKLYPSVHQGVIDIFNENEGRKGNIDRMMDRFSKINNKVPFPPKDMPFEFRQNQLKARYRNLLDYFSMMLNMEEDGLINPTRDEVYQYLLAKQLDRYYKFVFGSGGYLHIAEGPKQLTKQQKAAVRLWESKGGYLGRTALISLERGNETSMWGYESPQGPTKHINAVGGKDDKSSNDHTPPATDAGDTPMFSLSTETRPTNIVKDKGFIEKIKDKKFLNIPNDDLTKAEAAYSLPRWIAKHFPEMGRLLNRQEMREEERVMLRHEFLKMSDAFMTLKDQKELSNVEKALTEGNKENKVWDAEGPDGLKERFGLTQAGIDAYKSVRTTLETIHERWLDRAEQKILETYKGQRWYSILSTLFDRDLSPEDRVIISSYLNRIKSTEKKPVEFVKDLLKRVFVERAMTPEDNKKLAQAFAKAYKAMGHTLTKDERADLINDFQANYNRLGSQLSPEERLKVAEALSKVHKRLKGRLPAEEHIELAKTFDSAFKKLTKQVDDLKDVIRALNPEAEMTEEQLNASVRELVSAYSSVAAGMNELKKMRSDIGKQVGYFPEDHGEGQYYIRIAEPRKEGVTVGEDTRPRTLYFRKVKNTYAAKKLYDKLNASDEYKDMRITYGRINKENESTFTNISDINTQRIIDNAISQLKMNTEMGEGMANDIRKSLLTTISDELKARGFGKHSIKRKANPILGYEENGLKRVLSDYITGYTGIEAKQDAAIDFFEILKEIPKSKTQLFAYMSQYTQNMLRNQESIDRLIGKMKAIAFGYFLGGNLKSAAVQGTQNYLTGMALLSREAKGSAIVIYHKAMLDVIRGNYTDAEKKMIDDMLNRGIVEDQYTQQILRETRGAFSKNWGKLVDAMGWTFSHMERFNRKSAALAMFRVQTKKGASYDEAFDKAKEFVYDTHYLMTKANDPQWAAGGDAMSQSMRLLYTFRKFQHNYVLSMVESMRGADGKLDIKKVDVIGRSLAFILLFGGMASVPWLDDLLDELEKLTGNPYRSKMRRAFKGMGGDMLEKFGMNGLPALIGFDLSGSLKIGLPFPLGGTSNDVFGVYLGLALKGARAIDSAFKGEWTRAAENALPAAGENVLKAYRMATKGATNPQGKVMFDENGKPLKLTTGEAIGQAVGFRPEKTAALSQERRTSQNIEAHYSDIRHDLYSRFRIAATDAERQEVIKAVQKYNREVLRFKGAVPIIKGDALRRSLRQKPDRGFMRFEQAMDTE
jgi:hypothetical protein